MVAKISTGVGIIDELLEGGVERGSSTLVRASPFVDVAMAGIQFAHHYLECGDEVIYFVNNRSPASVIEEADAFGFEMRSKLGKGLSFIDAYSKLFGIQSSEDFFVEDPLEISSISEAVTQALVAKSRTGKEVLMVDSLSTLVDQCGLGIVEAVENWNRIALVHDCLIYYVYTEWGYPADVSERMDSLFPNIVDFKTLERLIANHILTVSKSQGNIVTGRRVPIHFVKPGGLRGYVPKILVTGPYHAGKTTLVHTLSTRAVSVQRLETTVALDFGHVDYRGYSLDLFGTAGQPRFDPLLKLLGGEALGVVVVVDSTKPEDFPRAVEMIHKAGVFGLPYVVMANKQDLSNALTVEQVRERMKIPQQIKVFGTVATDKPSVLRGLDALLDGIWDS